MVIFRDRRFSNKFLPSIVHNWLSKVDLGGRVKSSSPSLFWPLAMSSSAINRDRNSRRSRNKIRSLRPHKEAQMPMEQNLPNADGRKLAKCQMPNADHQLHTNHVTLSRAPLPSLAHKSACRKIHGLIIWAPFIFHNDHNYQLIFRTEIKR